MFSNNIVNTELGFQKILHGYPVYKSEKRVGEETGYVGRFWLSQLPMA